MAGSITALLVIVAGASALAFGLMTRLRNRRASRPSFGRGYSSDLGTTTSGENSGVASWFGGHHSSVDGCGNPVDGGSSDGGGGDGGGGSSSD